jgi:hypothetical protein
MWGTASTAGGATEELKTVVAIDAVVLAVHAPHKPLRASAVCAAVCRVAVC